jgi:hypothetical protein
MIKLITRKTAIAAALSLTVVYPAYSAVPNNFSAGQAASAADVNENFNDLDGRVDALETAVLVPSSIAVNCTTDADALKNTTITANTTYNITGACNGPIFVNDDAVYLTGSDNATDSIVLPAGLDETSAVWAGGAYDLRIINLFLDLTAVNADDNTAGIWARNSYVLMQDSRIQGGTTGIGPFRGGIFRLEGENSITEFSDAGLSAGDQSNINTRGQTTVTTTRLDNSSVKGLSAYRGSSIEIREGITVSVPPGARSIQSEDNATVRIHNSGTVDLTGDIRSHTNSAVQIDKGTINGDIDARFSSNLSFNNAPIINGEIRLEQGSNLVMYSGGTISGQIDVRRGSSVRLDGVTQTLDGTRAIRLRLNSLLTADGSNLGHFEVNTNSSIALNDDDGLPSTVKGGVLGNNSVATIDDTSVTGDIGVFRPAVLLLTGDSDMNNNDLKLCGTDSDVDTDTVINIGNLGTAGEDCP